jgi:hypothetical protein
LIVTAWAMRTIDAEHRSPPESCGASRRCALRNHPKPRTLHIICELAFHPTDKPVAEIVGVL